MYAILFFWTNYSTKTGCVVSLVMKKSLHFASVLSDNALHGLRFVHIADVQKPLPRRCEIGGGENTVVAWAAHLSVMGSTRDDLRELPDSQSVCRRFLLWLALSSATAAATYRGVRLPHARKSQGRSRALSAQSRESTRISIGW
jgi:hypothetical protein